MNTQEKIIKLYEIAYNYLLQIKPEEISEEELQDYFTGADISIISLEDVFVQLINSAQNYQQMPNVINFWGRKKEIKELLLQYDIQAISEMKAEDLYYQFRDYFNITSKDSKYNCWYKWSNSIVDSAKFINGFTDIDDFKHFVEQFNYNKVTRMALPLLISTKISGIGFALACDCLKELGYHEFPKPDVHLIDVLFKTGICDSKDQITVFETIVEMADVCKKIDSSVTAYKLDKIIWLICSGKFYLHDINVGRNKDSFIEVVLNQFEK